MPTLVARPGDPQALKAVAAAASAGVSLATRDAADGAAVALELESGAVLTQPNVIAAFLGKRERECRCV